MIQSSRIPKRLYIGQAMQMPMANLRMQWARLEEIHAESGYTGKRVLGIKVPHFQRSDDKWEMSQKVAFIESVYLGMSLGTYMVNSTPLNPALDMILLDGLQRLTALQQYWEGEFGVPGEDGVVHFWSDLTQDEKAHFDRISFAWIDTEYTKEEEAVEAYNRHNFGGTAHTDAERAVAKPE